MHVHDSMMSTSRYYCPKYVGHPQECVFQCTQQLWITTGFAGQDGFSLDRISSWQAPIIWVQGIGLPPTRGLTLSQ